MSNFKRISFGNLNSVMSDKIIYDRDFNEIMFVSLIGYASIIDASLNMLKGSAVGCYSPQLGTLRTVKTDYEIEVKRQSDSDYVHAIAYPKDIVNQNDNGEEIFAMLFCKDESDVEEKLFDKLIKYSSVPVLREWISYIKRELIIEGFLKPLIISSKEETSMVAYKLSVNKNQMKDIIRDGLNCRTLNINGINTGSPIMSEVKGLNDYLSSFGEMLAERIQGSFRPKFIPGEDAYDEYTNHIDDSVFSSGIEMYEAQKSVVQAAVNNLKVNDSTYVIGEMGSGKSLIGSCIPYAHHSKRNKGFNAVVLCPAHLTIKWKREAERAVPNSKGYIISDFSELKALEKKLTNKRKVENSFVIISKERAKMGYDTKPAVIWKPYTTRAKLNGKIIKDLDGTFVCPECGQTLYTREFETIGKERVETHVPFNELSMLKELSHNSRCMNTVKRWNEEKQCIEFVKCNTKLWEPLNRDEVNSKWIKLGKEGWIMKNHITSMTE
ncbi:MAG: DEAD/DEAH box helicase family protein, partial [Paraclostridium sp.]